MKSIFLVLVFLAQICAEKIPASPENSTKITPSIIEDTLVTSPEEDAIKQKENQTLAEQLEAIEKALQQNPDSPKILLLGSYPSQLNHFIFPEFSNPNVVYINRSLAIHPEGANISDMSNPHFIKADLTDVSFLNEMVARFSGHFDLITVNLFVTKKLNLNFEHINLLANLLKPGGKLVFDYSEKTSSASTAENCIEQVITNDKDITTELKKFPLYEYISRQGSNTIFNNVGASTKKVMQDNYGNYLANWLKKNTPPKKKKQKAANSENLNLKISFIPSMLPFWNPIGPTYTYIKEINIRYPQSHIEIIRQ